ncbi:MAG: carboxylating nicotinate-nucleotide diphosphorylase [Caldimicrobium sp.]|jgi:nicotinate-nucleotide pyrophosphorylase (carboxylating)
MELWQLREIVLKALQEDLPFGDKTTEFLIPQNLFGRAYFLVKSDLVICGEPIVELVFYEIDPSVKITWLYSEGAEVPKKSKIGFAEGRVSSLLKAERVALNFLQHLSGIATTVRRLIKDLPEKPLLLDTRKTLPGLKILQKYAVRIGGAKNHRFSLSDGILIKDNHIKALGGLEKVLDKLKNLPHYLKVEIEVKNLSELEIILKSEAQVDIVMLDNFSLEDLKEAISLIRSQKPNLKIEISGGITEENLKDYIQFDVDFISSGALTHSVKASDISFKIEEIWEE